jgi:AcrR family transcriptional regulator
MAYTAQLAVMIRLVGGYLRVQRVAKILDILQAFVKSRRRARRKTGTTQAAGEGGEMPTIKPDTDTGGALTRPGIYTRGAETVDLILQAALDVLIEEGAAAFTLRRIAARCDMKVGNLSYHFARKEMLIQLLLDDLLDYYEGALDDTARRPGVDPERQLTMMIEFCLDDIGTMRTTRLFTELWALANQNEVVADRVTAFYRHAHGQLASAIAPLNPKLSIAEVDAVARFISASMEGTTIFAGYGKAWERQMPQMKALAVKSLVHLAKTVAPGDIPVID